MRKIISIIFAMVLVSHGSNSQSIYKPTIGSIGGQFRNGNVILNYTLGESFVGSQANGNVQLGSGFWSVVPASYASSSAIVYRFIGNGNFSNAANWEGNSVPPNPLPAGSEIIITPVDAGECVLNISFKLLPGAKFSVLAGKKLLLPGLLEIK